MDLEQTFNTLLSANEQLGQENEHLKSMLSVYKENNELRARMQSFNDNTLEASTAGRKLSRLWQTTFDERQFQKDLQQTKFKNERRTSSPADFRSFIQSSVHTDTSEKAESRSCQADVPLEVRDRLLGEIAFQLDRRILSHVFQGHKRLYGFTLLNIPDKIIEVSTHPLTGKVDEGYRLHLTQRYAGLMEQLNQLGYKKTLHPLFTEFIINTFGILKERPGQNSIQAMDYNNPDILRKLIKIGAPKKLQEALLIVLTCLCDMAEKDKKPLLIR
ncbi:speriolin-like protein isoform X2 [Scophthalmus maximus]|uniref:speriolin-like protein isoform X2 n=1 Tax=Scophthalmus maximus TaxID=52904 RepID=UPI0015E09781|nr:speriolin-like protein isoform X2 [Scophthalmus maximus]